MKESLQSENIPDPMEGEQTWPTEEELVEAEEEARVMKHRIKKVPRGMSEYQAAWIPDSDAGEMHDYYSLNYELSISVFSDFPCQD
jgi:pre-rRNA-processing protein TSR1